MLLQYILIVSNQIDVTYIIFDILDAGVSET
jgi:hypothetical protein